MTDTAQLEFAVKGGQVAVCAACGRLITGKYTIALGREWHPEHFVCSVCRRPVTSAFYENDAHVYCEKHYWQRFGFRCAVGGEVLRAEYIKDYWGDLYCKKHSDCTVTCYSCGRPICQRLTKGGVRYRDGRSICGLCRSTCLDDATKGQSTLNLVRSSLTGLGLDLGPDPVPLRLADQDELNRLSTHSYSRSPCGLASYSCAEQDGRVIRRRVNGILILHGLPREHLAAIAAHELGHAFMFLKSFPALDPVVNEGLCELCAYLWLKQQNTPQAAYRLRLLEDNNDVIYGRGFHEARSSYQESASLSHLLAFVHQHRRFP